MSIPSDTFVAVFTSDRDVSDWGVKFTVTATLQRAYAPPVPNADLRAATLSAAAISALDAVLRCNANLVASACASHGNGFLVAFSAEIKISILRWTSFFSF